MNDYYDGERLRVILGNVFTVIENFPKKNVTFKDEMRELLSYEVEEYFNGKRHTIKKTLMKIRSKSFPSGLTRKVLDFFRKNKIPYTFVDQRDKLTPGKPLNFKFKLRDYQQIVVDNALKQCRGIAQIATGGGKTVIGGSIISQLNCPTIFCVNSIDLLKQTHRSFSDAFEVDIGWIGDGKIDIKQITVCTVQSLNSALGQQYVPFDELDKDKDSIKNNDKQAVIDYLKTVNCVIVDEVHHLSAKTYVDLMECLPNAYYRFGLSGTPYREDGRDILLQAYAGKTFAKISASELIKRGFLSKPTIYMINPNSTDKYIPIQESYQYVYKNFVVENKRRNKVITTYAKWFFENDYRLLILVNQVKHGKVIYDLLKNQIDGRVEFLKGDVKLETRTRLLDDMRYNNLRIIIGTTLCDEGLDIPIVDGLILAGAGKSVVRIPQRIGRTLRLHPDKKDPVIIDFYDRVTFLTGQAKARIGIYETEPEFKVMKKF